MRGLSNTTGNAIAGLDHLRQSAADILTTPAESRVMRREYGSRLFTLVDKPLTPAGRLQVFAAAADALARWEPRFSLTRIKMVRGDEGGTVLDMAGRYLPEGKSTGELVVLEGVIV